MSPKKHSWKPGAHRSQEGIRLEPSQITPRPVTLKHPAEPPNPFTGGTFSQAMKGAGMLGPPPRAHRGCRGNTSQKGAWRDPQARETAAALGSTCLPDAPRSAGGEGSSRGQGHQRCLTGFVEKGPCRGRGSREEIPAWGRKSHPGWIPGHVCTCLARERQEAARDGAERRRQSSPTRLGCSFLHPWNALESCKSPVWAQPPALSVPSAPSLLCEGEMLRWELQFPQT